MAISTENKSDVLQGVLGLCDQDCEAEYSKFMSRKTEHFFIDVDSNDLDADVVGEMDKDAVEEDRSIIRFLTLPTISTRMSNKKQDPIVDF